MAVWEALVEGNDTFKILDLLRRERNGQRLYISLQVFDLAPANDREDVGNFLHDVGDSD